MGGKLTLGKVNLIIDIKRSVCCDRSPLCGVSGVAAHGVVQIGIPAGKNIILAGGVAIFIKGDIGRIKRRSGGAGQEVLVFLICENFLVLHAIGVGDSVLDFFLIGDVVVVLVIFPGGGVSGITAHGVGHLGVPASKNIIFTGGVAIFIKGDVGRIKRGSGNAGGEVSGHLIHKDLLVVYAVGVGDCVLGIVFYGYSEMNGLLIPVTITLNSYPLPTSTTSFKIVPSNPGIIEIIVNCQVYFSYPGTHCIIIKLKAGITRHAL